MATIRISLTDEARKALLSVAEIGLDNLYNDGSEAPEEELASIRAKERLLENIIARLRRP